MKLVAHNHGFEGNLPEERISFKIQSSAKLFNILSSGIYEDKILAVIRELSCNAYDAHIAADKREVPFFIKLPNWLEATFSITDVGTGIDPAKIGDIFWTYGASTKAESNEYIGALGLGSKSPFAYTKSSFTVKNRFKGIEYHYLCFINEQGTPDGSKLAEIPTTDPDGITIEFAVRQNDITAFHERVRRFYTTWGGPLPIFSGEENFKIPSPQKLIEGRSWYLQDRNGYTINAIALMGNVPYPINAAAIPNLPEDLAMICKNPFVIKVPMGGLNFASSREGLEYDEHSCAQLIKLLNEVRLEFVEDINARIFNSKTVVEFFHNFITEFNKFKTSFKTSDFDDNNTVYLKFLFGKASNDTLKFGTTEYLITDLLNSKFARVVDGISSFGIYEITHRAHKNNLVELISTIELEDLANYKIKTSHITYSSYTNKSSEIPFVVDGFKEDTYSVSWMIPRKKTFRSYSMASVTARLTHAITNPLEIKSETKTQFKITSPNNLLIIINDLGTAGIHRANAYVNKHKSTGKKFFYAQNPYAKDDFASLTKSVIEWAGDPIYGIDVELISNLPDEREKIEVETDTKDLIKVPCSVWGLQQIPVKGGKVESELHRMSGFDKSVNLSNRTVLKLSELKKKDVVYYTLRNRSKDVLEPTGESFCLSKYTNLQFINEEKLYEHILDDDKKLTILNLTESEASGLIKRGVKLKSVLIDLKSSIEELAKKEGVYEIVHEYQSMFCSDEFSRFSQLQHHIYLKKLIDSKSPLNIIFDAYVAKDKMYLAYEKALVRTKIFDTFINVESTAKPKKWHFNKIFNNYPLLKILIKNLMSSDYQLVADYINQQDSIESTGNEISEIMSSNVFFSLI